MKEKQFSGTESQAGGFKEILEEKPIELLPEAAEYTKEQLKEMFPGKRLVVCDFNVKGLDSNLSADENFKKYGILNIDHHSDAPEMERQISSTNLAIEWIRKHSDLLRDELGECVFAAHHIDCDSVLSNALMRGILPRDDESLDKFGAAAIAADHTGAEDKIADLLQAIQDRRDNNGERSLAYSLEQLQLMLEGKPLDREAENLLQERYVKRRKLQEMVKDNGFKMVGGVAYAVLGEKIDGSLVPGVLVKAPKPLSEAKIILLFSPLEDESASGRREVKIRLGAAAPTGMSLRRLGINKSLDEGGVDPAFGGRWNAGNNKRRGGTNMDPDLYAKKISELVDNY